MKCAYCGEGLDGHKIRQGDEVFCSLECANASSGLVSPDEEEGYYEEYEIEGLYNEDEE